MKQFLRQLMDEWRMMTPFQKICIIIIGGTYLGILYSAFFSKGERKWKIEH